MANGNDPFRDLSFVIDPWGNRDPRVDPRRQVSPQQAEIDAMKAKIAEQQDVLIKQDQVLRILTAAPFMRATVIALGRPGKEAEKVEEQVQPTVLLSMGGQMLEVQVPPKMKLGVGTTVRISPKNMAIIDVVEEVGETPNGVILNVAGVLDPSTIEVDIGGVKKTVNAPMKVEKGDRVLVDQGMSVVMRNLGKQADEFKADVEKINVSWDDIGGQKGAKTEMREAIEGPIKHAAIFKAYGKKAVKGILLYGPPGCGKTMLAKAAATSLAALHGKSTASGFIYVKGPEILNKWVGQSEETIRNLFTRARDHYKREGYPAVLFIDEADAILGARGTQSMISGMEKTIVPMFLAEMDGLDEHGPLVLLATNRADSLDPAIVRDGRVDRKIEVTRPDQSDAQEIFSMYLKGKPVSEATKPEYAEAFAKRLFSSTLKMRVCGALIAGLVDQAISLAMRRDIASGVMSPSGLTMDDIDASVRVVESQNVKVA